MTVYKIVSKDGRRRGASDYHEAAEYAQAVGGQLYEEVGEDGTANWTSSLIADYSAPERGKEEANVYF